MKKKPNKGDKKKFFGVLFTFNGKIWLLDYIKHPKSEVNER